MNPVIVVRKLHEIRLDSYKEVWIWKSHKMKSVVNIFNFKKNVPVVNLGLEKDNAIILRVRHGSVLEYHSVDSKAWHKIDRCGTNEDGESIGLIERHQDGSISWASICLSSGHDHRVPRTEAYMGLPAGPGPGWGLLLPLYLLLSLFVLSRLFSL